VGWRVKRFHGFLGRFKDDRGFITSPRQSNKVKFTLEKQGNKDAIKER
jgi:hypothetical protein